MTDYAERLAQSTRTLNATGQPTNVGGVAITGTPSAGNTIVASSGTAAAWGASGGAPTGSAGGDLSGTYPNPGVVDDSHAHTASTLPGLAPTNADYLVGTANAGLSAEIVAGTTPGGELGGTWASPTVDATHSGSAHPLTETINFIIDGGGTTITTGIKGDVMLHVAGTITEWEALADQSGSIVVDIWKDTYANFPPTVADTITGAEKPTISTATKGQDTSLNSGAGWAVSAGDILRFNVDSITTCQRVTIALKFVRS